MKTKWNFLLGMLACILMISSQSKVVYAESYTTEDGKFVYSCDYYEGIATIHKYIGEDTVVEFPTEIDGCKVTTISNIGRREGITKIIIPDTVTKIGTGAFALMEDLVEVEMSDNIEVVGGKAFYECTALESISFPATIKEFGVYKSGWGSSAYGVFEGCSALKKVEFAEDAEVKIIATSMFRLCYALENVTLPKGLQEIGDFAFSETGIKSIELPNVVSIGKQAFSYCKALEKVQFGKKLEIICSEAFKSTGIVTLKLPKNVCVRESAFSKCDNLVSVVISKKVDLWAHAFDSCSNLEEVIIKPGVTEIDIWTFPNSGLRKIVIPDTVSKIGKYAFYKCENLEQIVFLGVPEQIEGIDEGSKVRVYGYKDTIVQEYAKQQGVRFIALNCPTKVKATSNKGQVELTWQGVDGVKEYTIYRSTSENGKYKKQKTVTGNSYTDKNVKLGKTYYYRIAIDYADLDGIKISGVMSDKVSVEIKK